jgi:hypothetical protein
MLALTPVVAFATSADHAQSATSSTMTTSKGQLPIAGVVTGVKNDKLSIMAPSSTESKISSVGNTLTVEKGMSFQTVTGSLGNQAQILRDGKKASLSDIKQGDVVHAAYDPATSSFSNIRVVSSQEFENDQQQSKTDLGAPGASAPLEK